jgi:hypothetical protein
LLAVSSQWLQWAESGRRAIVAKWASEDNRVCWMQIFSARKIAHNVCVIAGSMSKQALAVDRSTAFLFFR